MIFELVLAFVTGILVKVTDEIIDNKKKILFTHSELLFGGLYGYLIAVMLSKSKVVGSLWIGIITGVFVTGKIKGSGHYAGLISMIIFISILGSAGLNYTIIFSRNQ